MEAQDEGPRRETGGQDDQKEPSSSLTDSDDGVKAEDLPAISGMLSGKARPGPREPDTTHYRGRRHE
jgi:hypothetical protein